MADWESVGYRGPTPPLDEYLAAEAEDSNAFWRIDCGHHQNLLDSAVEQRDEARAEVERLRAEVAEHLLRSDSLRAELARCQAENERMEAAVQAVRDLHCKATDEDDHDWCEECADLSDGEMSYWPCSTIVALDAALGGERDE